MQLEAVVAQGVANAKNTGVKYADNITGISLFNNGALLRQKLLRLRQLYQLAALLMIYAHALVEDTGANAHKGNSVAMSRIHISLNFKYKGGKVFILRHNHCTIL